MTRWILAGIEVAAIMLALSVLFAWVFGDPPSLRSDAK